MKCKTTVNLGRSMLGPSDSGLKEQLTAASPAQLTAGFCLELDFFVYIFLLS